MILNESARNNKYSINFGQSKEIKQDKSRNEFDFTFVKNKEGIKLDDIEYPNEVYKSVMLTDNYDIGYNNEDKCREKIERIYKITDYNYKQNGKEGNQLRCCWSYTVKRGNNEYIIEVDPMTFEIVN